MQGLVCKSRVSLQPHKQAFAHNVEYVPDLQIAVDRFRPTALIGVSTQASSFTKPIIEAMARHNKRPIIFPLSNPTDKSECTFQDALKWTSGQVLFASGTIPFRFSHAALEMPSFHASKSLCTLMKSDNSF